MSKRIDLVDGVARRPARLPVEVVALNEHRVVGLAPDPHVALPHKVQLRIRESGENEEIEIQTLWIKTRGPSLYQI